MRIGALILLILTVSLPLAGCDRLPDGGDMLFSKVAVSGGAGDAATPSELAAGMPDGQNVSRDITTVRSPLGDTVSEARMTVSGREFLQPEPAPEELAASDTAVRPEAVPQIGYGYHIEYEYVRDDTLGFEVLDKAVLECFLDGVPLWKVDFPGMYIYGWSHTEEGTAVWGQNYTYASTQITTGFVARVDEKGNVVWERRFDRGFAREDMITAVLSAGDGTWAVISRGDLRYLCVTRYDTEGKEIGFRQTDMGVSIALLKAAVLKDGYLVQMRRLTDRDHALLIKLDREGNFVDSFSYDADDCEYYITDMTEYAGQIYVSAYAVPKQSDEGGRHEIANVLDLAIESGWNISGEVLTPAVWENYTAVLLVCGPDGTPRSFFSAEGSLGGKLTVNAEGLLEWDAESVTSTFFSPYTSSFTIGGTCKVYRYTFDDAGQCIGQTDTGEVTTYRR